MRQGSEVYSAKEGGRATDKPEGGRLVELKDFLPFKSSLCDCLLCQSGSCVRYRKELYNTEQLFESYMYHLNLETFLQCFGGNLVT